MNFYVSFLNNIALKIVANNIKYVWQLTGFLSFNTFLFFIVICFVTYWLIDLFFYFVLCINVVNLLSIKKSLKKKILSELHNLRIFFINKHPFIHGSFFLSRFTSIYKGFMENWIHLKKLKWQIHDGRWFHILLQNKWRHQDITAIVNDY